MQEDDRGAGGAADDGAERVIVGIYRVQASCDHAEGCDTVEVMISEGHYFRGSEFPRIDDLPPPGWTLVDRRTLCPKHRVVVEDAA